MKIKETTLTLPSVSLTAGIHGGNVTYSEFVADCHHHNNCEIYINISGDVSFRVEDKVYGIQPGDAIITRPYEKHHCIYHSICQHDHYCINFSCAEDGGILGLFFDRAIGESNLIRLAPHNIKILMEHCNTLVYDDDVLHKHIAFYSIIDLLTKEGFSGAYKNMPADVRDAVDYINENLTSKITIKKLAQLSHVTENTLTRHFNSSIGMPPYAYITNLRFSRALSSLEGGATVTEAAVSSGFADYSHFIAEFKKRYGKTPYQMKKDNK